MSLALPGRAPSRLRNAAFAVVCLAWLGGCATGGGARPTPAHASRFDPRAYYSRSALYVLHGEVSYYADSLAGNHCASGEIYDPNAYTAAHRHLPFGTILRVIRRDTGHWVLVRVNDRGPFAGPRRILDVSRIAAKQLAIIHKGFAEVDIEVLELGQKPVRASRRR